MLGEGWSSRSGVLDGRNSGPSPNMYSGFCGALLTRVTHLRRDEGPR